MNAVAIVGTVTRDGRFRAGWWSGVADQLAPAGVDSDWSVAALDREQRVLATAPATVTELPCGSDEIAARLRATLPLPPDSAYIVVKHAGAETYRRDIPTPAGLHLEFDDVERALRSRGPLRMTARITEPPGPGSHLIALWQSPSQPELPLGLVDVGSGEPPVVDVDLDTLPGGDGCRLRVVYNDGVRTTEVLSPSFDVPARPATPVIEAPAALHQMRNDGWLSLHGRLDGDGDPDELEWLLDGTPIAAGPRAGHARPGVGQHRLTLRHGKESVSVPLTVVAAPAPAETAPWEPPWRSQPLIVHAKPSVPNEFDGHRGQ